MIEISQIEEHILEKIPDAKVLVEDLTGEGKNFAIDVISDTFQGKNVVQQHQLVYQALGEEFKQKMHAIKVHTSIKST